MAFRRDERQKRDWFNFAPTCRYPDKLIRIKFDKPECVLVILWSYFSTQERRHGGMRRVCECADISDPDHVTRDHWPPAGFELLACQQHGRETNPVNPSRLTDRRHILCALHAIDPNFILKIHGLHSLSDGRRSLTQFWLNHYAHQPENTASPTCQFSKHAFGEQSRWSWV